MLVMGSFINNVFVPEQKISVEDGTRATLNIDELAESDEFYERQLAAIDEFIKANREDPEKLGEEFDRVLADRPRFREVDFS